MATPTHRGFRRLLPYLGRHKARFALGLALVPIFTGIQLWIPRIYGSALARLEGLSGGEHEAPGSAFWIRTVLLLAGLWVTYSSLRFAARYLQIGLSRRLEEELRNDLFAHLQRLPARFFDQARIGDLVARSTQDVELLRFVAGPSLFFGLATAIVVPGALIQVVSISPVLAVTVVALFGLVLLGLRFSFPRLAKASRAVQDAQAEIAAKAQEDFSGVRVLHAFARERAEGRAFAELAETCRRTQVDMARSRALLHSTFVGGGKLAPFCVIVVGVVERLPVSVLFEAYLYMQMLVWPMLVIGWILQTWHRARAAADRLDEIFDVAPERAATDGDALSGPLVASIEARGLSFRYSDDAPPALEDVSFHLDEHRTLGLVGPIGSGKSTLISLLARLYDPPRGTLLLGGVDVLDIPLAELRAHFAVAPQDPFLFSDTLRGNILFGAGDGAEDTDVGGVIRAAHLQADLESFPERLDELVGERGVTLSGGQKQRTSLARALAAPSSVLVLDDTLSAVDHDTEQHILETLREGNGRRTTIIVAHRLEAVREADLIVVLDQGRLVERGTHDELVARGGWYARTWDQQQRDVG